MPFILAIVLSMGVISLCLVLGYLLDKLFSRKRG
jgi:hypothetical protein